MSENSKVCSICNFEILEGQHEITCSYCNMPYHAMCWRLNKGCKTKGCQNEGKPEDNLTQPIQDIDSETVKTNSAIKTCPACGSPIPITAIVCRVCRAAIDNTSQTRERQAVHTHSSQYTQYIQENKAQEPVEDNMQANDNNYNYYNNNPQSSLGYKQADYNFPVTYAGFWRRFWALFIDGLVLGGVGFIFGLLIGSNKSFIYKLIFSIISWLYFAVMESSQARATFGKMALGIMVTDLHGNGISFGRATGRYFGKFLSSLIILIGYIMAGFTEKKQALHDMIANTLVVRK